MIRSDRTDVRVFQAMIITLLADSNALRHPGLKAYLQGSRNHWIALSDMTLVEMRKRNALSTSRESLQIASAFPDQVYVLRRTDLMLEENVRSARGAEQLFDAEASADLEVLCKALQTLPPSQDLREWMAEEEASAQQIMARLTEQVAEMEPALIEAASDFTPAQLTQIRTGKDVAKETQRKILDLLKDTMVSFVLKNQAPMNEPRMLLKDTMDLFAFRYSLCVSLYYLEWVRLGRTGRKLSRRVNDVVDMQVAAMATYFNGVLSRDDALQTISERARAVLRGYGGYCGEDWPPRSGAETRQQIRSDHSHDALPQPDE